MVQADIVRRKLIVVEGNPSKVKNGVERLRKGRRRDQGAPTARHVYARQISGGPPYDTMIQAHAERNTRRLLHTFYVLHLTAGASQLGPPLPTTTEMPLGVGVALIAGPWLWTAALTTHTNKAGCILAHTNAWDGSATLLLTPLFLGLINVLGRNPSIAGRLVRCKYVEKHTAGTCDGPAIAQGELYNSFRGGGFTQK